MPTFRGFATTSPDASREASRYSSCIAAPTFVKNDVVEYIDCNDRGNVCSKKESRRMKQIIYPQRIFCPVCCANTQTLKADAFKREKPNFRQNLSILTAHSPFQQQTIGRDRKTALPRLLAHDLKHPSPLETPLGGPKARDS